MPSDYNRIRTENIKEYGEGTRHLSFLGQLYTDRTHFVFELLQNAEDARASRISFVLFPERLEVKHDGRPFDEKDVRGVCGVGEGTKAEDLTQIGRFGIGFKSVYAFSSSPEVHSGDEHFRIEHYVRPYQAKIRKTGTSWTTLLVFPFDMPSIDPDNACREIAERLRNLSARTLLFLRNIEEIECELPDGTLGSYLRDVIPRGPARQITVIGENNDQEEDENWLVFERPVLVPGSTDAVCVEVGFWLEANEKNQSENIVKINDSPLVVYFPTEKETRLGFLMQGPYRTTPSRDNIPKDDQWNTTLVKETAILLSEALQALKEMGLLTVSLLETLPIRTDDFPSDGMFYPIAKASRDALMEQELLPSDDGTFVSARSAKLARGAELRKLLSPNQLQELFSSQEEINWLSGDITENRTRDLYEYLKTELKIDEIRPRKKGGATGFAEIITSSFLENRSDEWMVAFYRFLGGQGQDALWKKGGGTWYDPPGPLRNKPFIRLQDGTHVPPFKEDGSPNAYLPPEDDTEFPVVTPEITKDEKAMEFLENLKLYKPNAVDEVVVHIIPKYSRDIPPIFADEHQRDMKKILRA